MHEMALAENVLRIVEDHARRAGAERVVSVRLELGALSHVEPRALDFSFEAVARGSLAEGARLVIERRPGRALCAACLEEVEISALGESCPRCGGHALQVTSGEEMRVRDMEVA